MPLRRQSRFPCLPLPFCRCRKSLILPLSQDAQTKSATNLAHSRKSDVQSRPRGKNAPRRVVPPSLVAEPASAVGTPGVAMVDTAGWSPKWSPETTPTHRLAQATKDLAFGAVAVIDFKSGLSATKGTQSPPPPKRGGSKCRRDDGSMRNSAAPPPLPQNVATPDDPNHNQLPLL